MVFGNVLVAAAAFLFVSPELIDWPLFFILFVGLSLVISSACTFNNYFDRRLDAKMERTKNRALPAGRISPGSALVFGLVLLFFGVVVLYQTNALALGAALLGFIVYVFLYTPLKPRTPHALWVGAVAGAMPPVVGYTAAANTLDLYALLLFVALFLWQIPHFLAIAVYRYEEYKAAGIPLFIKKNPSDKTKRLARVVFYLSLVVLLLACLALILQRWVR